MPTWPSGAAGKTPPNRPGSVACVVALCRLIMFTIGQPHRYAWRGKRQTYSGCGLGSVVGFDHSAKVVGVVACCANTGEAVAISAPSKTDVTNVFAAFIPTSPRFRLPKDQLIFFASSGFQVWSKNSTPVP